MNKTERSGFSMKQQNVIIFLLSIITIFVLGIILNQLSTLLLPLVLAILLSIIFKPIVLKLKEKRVPMALSLILVLLSVALIFMLLALPVFSSIGAFTEAMPRYEAKLDLMIQGGVEALKTFIQNLGFDMEDFSSSDVLQFSTLSGALASGIGTFFSFLGNIFMVMLFMLFTLAGSGILTKKVERALPPAYAKSIATIVENIGKQVRQYLVVKTLVSFGTGTLVFLLLWVIGVDFPLVWGFLTFVLNFIPNIGSLAAVAFPFLLSLLQFDTLLQPILVIVLLGSAQTLFGNVIEPRLMASSLNLSALLVLVSLIFWGWLWGIWGMVLAVPLTATIKIVFENIEALRPISILMSGPLDKPSPKKRKPFLWLKPTSRAS